MNASLIFVSLENWDEIWRRNQFICAELARRNPQRTILFVGLARDVTNAIRRRRLSDLRGGSVVAPDGLPNLIATRPLKLLPNTLRLGRYLNDWLFRRHVRKMARRLNLVAPILWLNPHSAVHLCQALGESLVVYDITDDWAALEQPAAVKKRIEDQDAELCAKADAVIVCSKWLEQLKSQLIDTPEKLSVIPNGVHPEHYRAACDEKMAILPGMEAWTKPVLGYVGTIHPERIDVALVEAIARLLGPTGGSVVLIGPNHLHAADRARLALPNIHMPGPVAYAQVPRYFARFDVCIVPHRITPFTESLNAIKLWEYLAAGKPIISTSVAGFRDFPQWVRIAGSASEFVAMALESLHEDPAIADGRRSEAMRNSWASRVDEVERVIQAAHERKLQAGIYAR